MEAVIYARYSSDRQRAESIEDQVRVCTEWAQREGHEVVRVYSDEAKSGTSDERPSYQQMMADAATASWKIVIVYKLDRFARNRYDSAFYRHELAKSGVRVQSATEAYSDGPEGVLLEGMLEALAEYYSKQLGQNAKRGMRGNALKCKANGVTLYGYDIDADGYYQVNEEQAQVVREAFRMAGECAGVPAIKALLDAAGAKTAKGGRPSDQMVRDMLRNAKYKGVYKWDDVVVEGGMPAIVDADTWAQAQGKFRARFKGGRADYWAVGKAMCECGTMMHGESAKGGLYHYYRCKKCKGYMRKEELEDAVTGALQYALTPQTRERIADDLRAYAESRGESRELARVRKRLDTLEAAEDRVLDAIAEGVVSAQKAQKKIDEVSVERDALRAREAELSRFVGIDELVDAFRAFALDVPADSELARMFVNRIVVGPEKVAVVFNFLDGRPTPDLAEIEAVLETPEKKKPAAHSVSTGKVGWQTKHLGIRTVIAAGWFAIILYRQEATQA